jgi:hypothetical protein
VADPHHDAAGHHERSGRESVFISPEQCRDDDVTPGLQLPVGLHDDAVAQPVQEQRLLGLGEAQLPRPTSVLEGRER